MSGIPVCLHPKGTDRDQASAVQPVVRHSGLRSQRPGQVPVALGTQPRPNCLPFARSQRQQVAYLGARLAPLLPVAHAHPAAQPVIQLGNRAVVVLDAEV